MFGGSVSGGKILGAYPDNLTTDGPQIINERGIGESDSFCGFECSFLFLPDINIPNIIDVICSATYNTIRRSVVRRSSMDGSYRWK